jgi:hypothetical protein
MAPTAGRRGSLVEALITLAISMAVMLPAAGLLLFADYLIRSPRPETEPEINRRLRRIAGLPDEETEADSR